jgi:hypothetical protein
VRSSTSSFRPLPLGWRSLAIAVLFAIVGLTSIEALWRARGVKPSLDDDEILWCQTRAQVSASAVVIVGSSHVQMGIDPAGLAEALHNPVVQLAVAGANGIPPLFELLRDQSFHGVLIFEYMPRRLFTPDTASTKRIQGFMQSCSNPSLVAGVEARLAGQFQSRLSFMGQEVQPLPVVSYVAHHKHLPHGNHVVLRADRYAEISYQADDIIEPDVWEPPFPTSELNVRFGEMESAIAAFKSRGGKIVLYRAPASGQFLQDEEARFPASQWFKSSAARIGAIPLDFADVPELRDLPLPDGEHPDASTVPALTRILSRELERLLR